MKVLITGVSGQLGHDAAKTLTARGVPFLGVGSKELDVTDREAVRRMFDTYRPDAVLHCAAWTKVDLAEAEPELCMRVNADGTRNVAEACRELGAKLLYVSTDYVFPGTGLKPWETDDAAGPLNVYGKSKLAGEAAVKELVEKHFIVRTSWVIGEHGNNFVKTMLRLAENHDSLRVVADQIGSPTFTADLAPLLCDMIATEQYGVYHATNEGFCSWAELAEAVFRIAGKNVTVHPVSTEEYGAKALRPKNSRLSKASLDAAGFARLPAWEDALAKMLEAESAHLSGSIDSISSSFFWKITKPARFTLDVLRWALRPHPDRHLLRKGLYSLRISGVRVTWQKAVSRIYFGERYVTAARQRLFTEQELIEQREHKFSRQIRFSIAVPLYNTAETFLRAMIESVLNQTYADWELCMADGSDGKHGNVERICREYAEKDGRICYRKLEKNLGISGNTNVCLEMAQGDFIGLLDHDDLLHPAALYEVMRAIEKTGADFIYTDESTFYDTPEDAYMPHFKPDFAPDNLRANNYICHFSVFKRSLLDEVGLFDPACDGSQDHDMVLRLTEKAQRIAHIPEILYYWRAHAGSVAESVGVKPYVRKAGIRAVEKQLERLGLEGSVAPVQPGQPIYRIRYAIKERPMVSILIVNHEHKMNVEKCLTSILKKTTWSNYEIVIAEDKNSLKERISCYKAIQQKHSNVRIIEWNKTDNSSAIRNYGAQFCTGEYLLLLNNDIEVITPDWIEEMLMLAQREDVGAVGAMLYYPNNTIRNAGICLGMGGIAGSFFQHVSRNNTGYMGRLLYVQNVSAVSSACMMLRREVWDKVGGLNEDWAVAFNDVDLCMRIRKAGYLIVWTPFAELYHYESKSRGLEDTPEKQSRFRSEVLRFQQRWKKELEAGDPYYNPNLSLDRSDFVAKPDVRQYDAR